MMKNFFNDARFQVDLQHQAKEARERLSSMPPLNELSGGDSFLFAESYDLPVRWVCILQHLDNSSLWYLVAADEFSSIGTCDIELPESHPLAPLALRCAVGFWAHRDDLSTGDFVGRLDSESVADARHRLAEMVGGRVPATEHGLVAEANDDYRDWIAQLSEVAELIEMRMHAEPVVLAKSVFDTSWTRLKLVSDRHSDFTMSLAADAVGAQQPVQAPPARVLPSKLAGELLLQVDGDNFDLVYYPTAVDEPPPGLILGTGINARLGEWKHGVDGVWTWSQHLSAKNGYVNLTIGCESFSIPIS